MKQYPNIISKLFYEPLIITPMRHAAICQLLESRMANQFQVTMPASPTQSETDDEDEDEISQIGDIAIIPVHGTIVRYPEDIAMSECGCDLDTLNERIDAAESDPRISTVIYDFRTPGGSVCGVPETGRKIAASRKNTVAFTESECCSGGIWLAAQCKAFFSTQSSRVGSVGVYSMSMDMSEAMKKDGIKVNAISAGKFKLLGAYWKELTDEERAIKQADVDKIYSQFKDAMETYRIVDDKHFGNGLCFDGQDAAEMGFTDGCVESLEDVLEIVS